MADLHHAPVLEQRLERCEGRGLIDLVGHDLPRIRAALASALAVGERYVAGLILSERQREPAQRRLHRVEPRSLRVHGYGADLISTRDPRIEPIERAHDLVARAIDF